MLSKHMLERERGNEIELTHVWEWTQDLTRITVHKPPSRICSSVVFQSLIFTKISEFFLFRPVFTAWPVVVLGYSTPLFSGRSPQMCQLTYSWVQVWMYQHRPAACMKTTLSITLSSSLNLAHIRTSNVKYSTFDNNGRHTSGLFNGLCIIKLCLCCN